MLVASKAIQLTYFSRAYKINSTEETSLVALWEELTDVELEQINGGAIYPPEAIGEATPLGIGYGMSGNEPYYTPLPKLKLPRLAPINPSNRHESPQNNVTITIPLPTP